jgi:hypothetical protein
MTDKCIYPGCNSIDLCFRIIKDKAFDFISCRQHEDFLRAYSEIKSKGEKTPEIEIEPKEGKRRD